MILGTRSALYAFHRQRWNEGKHREVKNVEIEIADANPKVILCERLFVAMTGLLFLSSFFWHIDDDNLRWTVKPLAVILGVFLLLYSGRFPKHHKRCYFSMDAKGISARCKLPAIPILPETVAHFLGPLLSGYINLLSEPDFVEVHTDWAQIKEIRFLQRDVRFTFKTELIKTLPIGKLNFSQRKKLQSAINEFASGKDIRIVIDKV